MDDQDKIKEFSRMLDLLAIGRNVSVRGDLDPKMVQIACTLAATDMSGMSQNRDVLRRRLGQHQSIHPIARMDNGPKRGISILAAFSMGFATVIALAYVSLVIILPAARHTGRDPSVAGVSAEETTLNALLAAVKHLASPTVTFSATPTMPEASPTPLPGWTPTLPPMHTEVPPAPSLIPTWTPTPLPTVTSTPWPTLTLMPTTSSSWSPPEKVDYVLEVQGDVGTVQQFSASLPSEGGATSHIIQIVVNIPAAEGNAGRRQVDYIITCTGTDAEKLRWGWWGWPPAGLVCGTLTTSNGLLWSHNVLYLIVEVPADVMTAVTYTLTVAVSEYSW